MSKRILVADDEKTAVEVLKKILEDKGFSVIEAFDGEAALKTALEQKPDLVILDVMMPKMNGYEVCRKIKNNETTNETPVIILTAKDSGEDIKMALTNGANWYITKPYDTNYLLSMVGNFLKKQ